MRLRRNGDSVLAAVLRRLCPRDPQLSWSRCREIVMRPRRNSDGVLAVALLR